jgi:hypothetical protein
MHHKSLLGVRGVSINSPIVIEGALGGRKKKKEKKRVEGQFIPYGAQ